MAGKAKKSVGQSKKRAGKGTKAHIKQLRKHFDKIAIHRRMHKRKVIKLLHRIKKHPKCYKPGHGPKGKSSSSSLPKKPKHLNQKASGLWDWVHSGWNLLKKHGAKVGEHLKGMAKDAAQEALTAGKDYVKSRYEAGKQQIGDALKKKRDKVVSMAKDKVKSYADKLDKHVNSATKKVTSYLQ